MQRLIQFSLSDDDLFWLRLLLLKTAVHESVIPCATLHRLIEQLDRSARARIPAPSDALHPDEGVSIARDDSAVAAV